MSGPGYVDLKNFDPGPCRTDATRYATTSTGLDTLSGDLNAAMLALSDWVGDAGQAAQGRAGDLRNSAATLADMFNDVDRLLSDYTDQMVSLQGRLGQLCSAIEADATGTEAGLVLVPTRPRCSTGSSRTGPRTTM